MNSALMEPRINDLQIQSRVHELLDIPVCSNQMSAAIYQVYISYHIDTNTIRTQLVTQILLQCPNDHTEEFNNENPKKKPYNCPHSGSKCNVTGDIPWLLLHLRNDHNVEMHDGRSFSHRYVHHNPKHLHHATWMLTVSYNSLLLCFCNSCEFLTHTKRCSFWIVLVDNSAYTSKHFT